MANVSREGPAKMSRRRGAAVIVCTATLLMIALGIILLANRENSHAPISIIGDLSFTQENGVVGGNGSPQDPYVIEGWDIVAPRYAAGILIKDTRAHLLIRDIDIRSNGSSFFGVTIENARNVTLEDVKTKGNHLAGIRISDCLDVSIRSCDSSSNDDFGIAAWSSENLTIAENKAAYNGHDDLSALKLDNCSISGNEFHDRDYGSSWISINIMHCTNVAFTSNLVRNAALDMENCTACIVSDNEFSMTWIRLEEVSYSTFSGNSMTDDCYLEVYYCTEIHLDCVPTFEIPPYDAFSSLAADSQASSSLIEIRKRETG